MTKILAVGLTAALVLAGATATAFPFETSWHMPADGVRAGAGDIYGTGGQQDFQIKCANCHINAPGKVGATVAPTPPWPLKAGTAAYQPGTTYTITVALTGEINLGPPGNPASNLNGFALTAEDAFGKLAGVFASDTTPSVRSDQCPPSFPATRPTTGTTYVYGTCHAVFSLQRALATNWTFKWTAPPVGTGPVTLFYGVVDGNTDGSSSLDDDVKQGTVKLIEN